MLLLEEKDLIEENLKIFTEEMKNGTEGGLKNCLRAKIDYTALKQNLKRSSYLQM